MLKRRLPLVAVLLISLGCNFMATASSRVLPTPKPTATLTPTVPVAAYVPPADWDNFTFETVPAVHAALGLPGH